MLSFKQGIRVEGFLNFKWTFVMLHQIVLDIISKNLPFNVVPDSKKSVFIAVKIFLFRFYIYTFRTRLLLSGSPLHHIAVAYCN